MPTNLAIDDDLLVEAQKLGQIKTKKDTVNLALQEFINRRKQVEIIELFNCFEQDEDYDYKKSR